MPRRIILLTLFALLAFTFPVAADSPAWITWLYDPGSAHLWLVDDAGTVLTEHTLPNPVNGLNYFPRLISEMNDFPRIAVSNAGRYLAYRPDHILHIIDLTTGEELIRYDQVNTFDTFTYSWRVNPFNENDNLMAYGVNKSDYQAMTGGWEILIFDLTTGNIAIRLRDTDPGAQAVGRPGFNFVPIVQNFEAGMISFFLHPDGIESGPHYAGWTWNMETGEVTPNNIYTTFSFDHLSATGEVISPIYNSRLEAYPCEGECPQFVHLNTLQVYDPAVAAPYPFYHSPLMNFWQVKFIQGGEKILTQANSFEPDSGPVWHIIERDGSLVADVSDLKIGSVASIPEGMIYTRDGSPDVFRVDTRAGLGDATVLWTSPDNLAPLILWMQERSQTTFSTSWAQLAPPRSEEN